MVGSNNFLGSQFVASSLDFSFFGTAITTGSITVTFDEDSDSAPFSRCPIANVSPPRSRPIRPTCASSRRARELGRPLCSCQKRRNDWSRRKRRLPSAPPPLERCSSLLIDCAAPSLHPHQQEHQRATRPTNFHCGRSLGESLWVPNRFRPIRLALNHIHKLDELGVDSRIPKGLGSGERVVEVQSSRFGEMMKIVQFGLSKERVSGVLRWEGD